MALAQYAVEIAVRIPAVKERAVGGGKYTINGASFFWRWFAFSSFMANALKGSDI